LAPRTPADPSFDLPERQSDLEQLRKNNRLERCFEYSQAVPTLSSSAISQWKPKRMFKNFRRNSKKVSREMISIADLHETPIVFLTSHCRPFHPGELEGPGSKAKYVAYKGLYFVAGFQHRLIYLLNDDLRTLCRREGIPLIDSAEFLSTLPQGEIFRDPFHLAPHIEEKHGRYIYDELRRLGL
jgi:hypothetical protein